ncbi:MULTISPECIES: cytochrome c/FTR1 family iron permease [Oxalobacteraceae]|uniref:cytochrome c/FTR1 family iron permease n=1 Tax=Oxalobacteraceae TaxID=75682 RepID=UPI0002AE9761|nr:MULTISPECIES: cytochrome c/FTR1 family iron permease [Oxalobacteraceae]ELX08346.1 high-affinity Fe2+/Pb2+ permease [Janthinobacterium sp. HH01]OEZ59037.1 ferrous iron permease EfeU precursor [Duganella sp. HH105]OFA00800.1 ferrous iron permease EfeU precursor [Duganella sp. HH101]
MSIFRYFIVLSFLILFSPMAAHAEGAEAENKAKQIWQLLDYLAVDYGKAVQDGSVRSASEYAEMQEFARAAQVQLKELPSNASTPMLMKQADDLRVTIDQKAAAAAVAVRARALASGLVAAYPVPMAPKRVPDIKRGETLFLAQCAACHGTTGHSDGPLAAKLNPPPIVLADHGRARERSVFALQQIISHGVDGTAMPSFAQLSEEDRWAIAYFASSLSYTDKERQAGASLWSSSPELRASVPSLAKLSELTETQLAAEVGEPNAAALLAYLRSAPAKAAGLSTDTLPLAKEKLKESLAALTRGEAATASRLALSAYLDGFEPVEPALAAKNKTLFEETEITMGSFRNAVVAGDIPKAKKIEARLQNLLTDAQAALAGANDPLSAFMGALTILLREGLEALLVVVAMIAFLKKADRRDVLPYVHAGWITALVAGGATWGVATYLVDLSGASREMTEGFSAIFAAVVLLSVGIWMHQKSMAGRWQAYVRDKLSSALNKSSALMLFTLAFVTVYREVFETVLFYAALWTEGNGTYMLAGLGSGIAILAVVAIVLLRSSARLPISQFFAFSSALVAILATVLMGKGVAALQKVGVFASTPIGIPRIDLLGLYPSVQTLLAQLLIVAVIVASVAYNVRSQKRTA